jgi:hypothetical protein
VSIGYSILNLLPTLRATAIVSPSADQSASCTPSSRSRGAPPTTGTRESVPSAGHQKKRRWRERAISPLDDTASTSAPARPSGRDDALSMRVVKTSTGLPPHAAP